MSASDWVWPLNLTMFYLYLPSLFLKIIYNFYYTLVKIIIIKTLVITISYDLGIIASHIIRRIIMGIN